MIIPIRFNRGVAAGIPTLQDGEPGWATDTHQLYVGTGVTNILVGGSSYTADESTLHLSGTTFSILDAELLAIAGLTSAADKLPYFTGGGTAALADFTAAGRALVDDADATAQRTTLGLGTAAVLASDTDGTLASNSDTRVATQKAIKTYVDTAVTGLLDFKGGQDCSANPNYPAASKGDAYVVTVAGKIGGASGVSVDVGDTFIASADNAGGTQAAVGASWFVLEHNLTGALVAANNLSDLLSASTARTNLGLGTLATQSGTFSGTHSGTSSGTNTGDQTITLTGDVVGSGTGSFVATISTVGVAKGGTGLTAGTSGGIPYYSGTTTIASSAALAQYGVMTGGGAGAAPATVAPGTSGQVLLQGATLPTWADVPRANMLANGGFRINQRGVTTYTNATSPKNDDATYQLDQWILLSESNDNANVSTSTSSPPTGAQKFCTLAVTATNNKKFGILQILENADTAPAVGGTVSVQVTLKVSNTRIGTARIGVVQWTGTADAPTRDVVSSWGVTGANPILVTSWAFANTPADLTLSTSWQTFKVESIAVSASATNIGVFVWNDDQTTTAADVLSIADVKLELGSVCTAMDRPPVQQQLARCQRHFWQLWDPGGSSRFLVGGRAASATSAFVGVVNPVAMRVTPTITLFGANMNINDFNVARAVTAVATSFASPGYMSATLTVATGLTTGNFCFALMTDTVSGLRMSAEL